MSKIRLLLILVLALGAAYLLIPEKQQSSVSSGIEDRNFVVTSPDDIAYITVKNPGYPLMHLKKNPNGNWVLNDRYRADDYVVKNMLGVLHNMTIKYIPPASMNSKILGELDQVGIAIKAYDEGGKLVSDFIMGANDSKEGASFCVKNGASQPYAMHVNVAEGGLRNYFTMPLQDLRDKAVFRMDPRKIQSLELRYPKDMQNSYRISRKGGSYEMESLDRLAQRNQAFNERTIESYLKDFDVVMAEAIRTGDIKSDSILSLVPFARLDIALDANVKKNLSFYPLIDLLVDSINTRSVMDTRNVERYFVFDEEGEVFIVQQRMVGKFFRPIEYFIK